MSKTKIEWTDETWNPVVGCSKVSEGCAECYAEKRAYRLACMYRKYPYYFSFAKLSLPHLKKYAEVIDFKTKKWNGKIYCDESALDKPLHWHRPRRIFVCSMSDLFLAPFEFIDKVFAVAALCPQHTFQILTKRVDVALEYFDERPGFHKRHQISHQIFSRNEFRVVPIPKGLTQKQIDLAKAINEGKIWPLPNVHLGVYCGNQRCADERIPLLLRIPAAKRSVSFEPLLGEIDFRPFISDSLPAFCGLGAQSIKVAGKLKIKQIIIGCESGPRRRPCKLEWVESLIDQADAAGVKVFVKQLSINGKVSHNPAEWPERFRRRELM